MKTTCSAVLIVVAALLSGCAAFSWLPFVDGTTTSATKEFDKDKVAPLVAISPEVSLSTVWRASVGKGLGRKYVKLSPRIAADVVFIADAYGLVEARDRFSGAIKWRVRVGRPDSKGLLAIGDRSDPSFVSGGVGIGAGLVFVGTTRAEVIALNANDGSIAWRVKVSSEVLAPPAASEDLVVAQAGDGRLHALEVADGSTRWVFDSQVPILSLRGTAGPVIDSGVVYAGFANGKLVAIDSQTGGPLWEQRVSLPQGTSELDRVVDIDGSPLVTRNFIYASSYQGVTRAFRRTDGAIIWERPIASHENSATGTGLVYFISDDDEIIAIDEQTAQEVWRQDALRNRNLSSPVAFGNYVIVGDESGYLHVLAQSDGRFVSRRKVGTSGVRSAMDQRDGVVFVYTNNGQLFALEVKRLG